MPPTVETLFERYRRAGDVPALGQVFDRTAATLIRVALHLCADRGGAEDLVQSTFVRAIEAATEWDATRPLTPWLIGILANQARRQREREARRVDPRRVAPTAPAIDPVAAAECRELTEAVDAAISDLPEIYRPVLRLYLGYGHAPAEIAHALERPPSTVRNQLARGLDALRRLLPSGLVVGPVHARPAGALVGVAAMRAEVLAAAHPLPGAAPATPTLIGAILMKPFAAVAALILVVTWLVWPRAAAPRASIHSRTDRSAAAALPDPGAAADITRGPATLVRVGDPQLETQPDRAVDANATGSLLVRATWGDGRPAGGVAFFAEPRGPGATFQSWNATTDAVGEARFEGLPPGQIWVETGRHEFDAGQHVTIAAAIEAVHVVAIRGVSAHGVVVDAEGAPVANASVLVASPARPPGRVLGQTDDAGRFHLPGLGATVRIGARAAGYAPSLWHELPAADNGALPPLRIELPGDGGRIEASVQDEEGQPIELARVWVRSADPAQPIRMELTDSSGHATVEGLQTGEVEIVAWARAWAPWRGAASISPKGRTPLTIRLEPGVVLEGTVRDTTGQPAEGCEVELGASSTAPFAAFGAMAFHRARTDRDGRYRITEIPAGLVEATVECDGRRQTSSSLGALPGQTLVWDPVVHVGPRVRGRILGPDGRGLRAIVEGGARGRHGWAVFESTDIDGQFWLRDVQLDRAIQLDVRLDYYPVLSFDGVVPRDGELVLRVTAEQLPSIRVLAHVVSNEGRGIPLAEVSVLRRGTGSSPTFPTDDDGRIDVGPFPPGDYKLVVRARGHATTRTEWVMVPPGQAADFDRIELDVGGTVEVRAYSSAPLTRALHFEVASFTGRREGHVQIQAGEGSLTQLPAGDYELRVRGPGLAATNIAFRVASGQTTRVDVSLQPGVPTTVSLDGTSGAVLPEKVDLLLVRDGATITLAERATVRDDGRVVLQPFGLSPGPHTIQARWDGAVLGAGSVVVPSQGENCHFEIPIGG